MGLFSCCFSQSTPKVGAESKPAIQKLKQWETTHFPIPRTYAWTNGSPNPATRYQIYRTEQGASISLKKMKIPAASSQSQEARFPNANFHQRFSVLSFFLHFQRAGQWIAAIAVYSPV